MKGEPGQSQSNNHISCQLRRLQISHSKVLWAMATVYLVYVISFPLLSVFVFLFLEERSGFSGLGWALKLSLPQPISLTSLLVLYQSYFQSENSQTDQNPWQDQTACCLTISLVNPDSSDVDTYLLFFWISSTRAATWPSMNSSFSFFLAWIFCSLQMRSTRTALSGTSSVLALWSFCPWGKICTLSPLGASSEACQSNKKNPL